MKRLTYKLDAAVVLWVFLFIVMGGLLVFSAWIGTIESSTREALWNAFKFANYGALILYIVSIVFYPMIKNLEEGNF